MEDIIKKFNLPNYIKGKSFSDASKAIMNKFKDREDNLSKKTMAEMLGRLKQAQEYVKSQDEINSDDNSNAMGGYTNDYFLGGLFGGQGQGQQGGSQAGNGMGMGAIGNALGAFGNLPDNTKPKGYTDKKLEQDKAINNSVEGVKDGVANALGPYGQLFRGIQKAGTGIGKTIGGDGGAAVADIFSPEESTISVMTDKDANFGQKLAATVPGVGGVISKRLAENRQLEAEKDQAHYEYNSKMNDYKYGGSMNEFPINPFELPDFSKFTGSSDDFHTGDNSIDYKTSKKPSLATNDFNGETLKPLWNIDIPKGLRSDAKTGKLLKADKEVENKKGSKALEWLKGNAGDVMRYAPALMNAFQLAKLKKPERENLAKLDNRYKKQLVDEKSMMNSIQNSFNDDFVTEGSGGNLGAYRSNARSSQLAKTKAISDAYKNAADINRNENKTEQQFNLGTDRFNASVLHREAENYARDIGAYNTEKSKLQAAIGDNIGDIGTELSRDEMIRELFDYTRKGKFQTNKNVKGGYLDDVFDYISSNYKKRFKK